MKLKEIFNSWEKSALALVAFLVVIPSIINAAGDVWVSVQNLPIGNKQKVNAAMFEDHFNETPAASERIDVENDLGTLTIAIDVYENGDIFIHYGQFTQWFPFQNREVIAAKFNLGLFASALARADKNANYKDSRQTTFPKIQYRKASKTAIERISTLEDGAVEKILIDVNSGEVMKTDFLARQESAGKMVARRDTREVCVNFDVRKARIEVKKDIKRSPGMDVVKQNQQAMQREGAQGNMEDIPPPEVTQNVEGSTEEEEEQDSERTQKHRTKKMWDNR